MEREILDEDLRDSGVDFLVAGFLLSSLRYQWQRLLPSAGWAVATIRTVVYRGVETVENLDFDGFPAL